ncbi:MAG: ABC transporter permease, partial [Firmicutes bacterium]|nr:ABC transporter permease [Bacillota bacterium]
TERVYAVPGVGSLLTNAINSHDNGIIIACTVFYTSLSVISLILGDLLMAKVDPRISFEAKAGR